MVDCGCALEASTRLERRPLFRVLVINAAMVVIELSAGLTAQSTGLLADSFDMLSDAFVYGISLPAVGGHPLRQGRIARFSGRLHMRASFMAATNDSLTNVGVIVSGLLVALTGSALPDLLIGLLIASLVLWGGVCILSVPV